METHALDQSHQDIPGTSTTMKSETTSIEAHLSTSLTHTFFILSQTIIKKMRAKPPPNL